MSNSDAKIYVDVDMAKLLYDDFRYKHSSYWQLFYRIAFSSIAILAFPFISKPEIEMANSVLLFFPIFSLSLCVLGAWIMYAEQTRLQRAAEKAFSAIDFLVERSQIAADVALYNDFLEQQSILAKAKVGKLLYRAILFGGIFLASLEALFLTYFA